MNKIKIDLEIFIFCYLIMWGLFIIISFLVGLNKVIYTNYNLLYVIIVSLLASIPPSVLLYSLVEGW